LALVAITDGRRGLRETWPAALTGGVVFGLGAIVAAAVGVHGKEGDIFRRVVIWSLVFLAFICALSGLQASVLSWMVP
jgi:L-lactate permease